MYLHNFTIFYTICLYQAIVYLETGCVVQFHAGICVGIGTLQAWVPGVTGAEHIWNILEQMWALFSKYLQPFPNISKH